MKEVYIAEGHFYFQPINVSNFDVHLSLLFYYLYDESVKSGKDMKRSIAHLPKQKQRDLYLLVQKVLERLPETTMIILYGNYAGENYLEYDERIEFGIPTLFMSDYDILVVTEGITDKEAGIKLDNVDDYITKIQSFRLR